MGRMVYDAALARYRDLIEGALTASVPNKAFRGEWGGDIRVERGVAYAIAIFPAVLERDWVADELEDLLGLSGRQASGPGKVIDGNHHSRPVYEGLLMYSAFQAIRLAPAAYADDGPQWADRLESRLAQTRWPESPERVLRAADGARVVEATWLALAAHVAGNVLGTRTDLASDAFGRLVTCQLPAGTFLKASAADNPETHGYHELLLLHAATSYAAASGDRAVEAAVARAAAFHLNETQPDHATNQPWGLAAFVRNPETRPLADQMLHAAATVGRSGVTSILLADALYCLRLWMVESL
jgi:hypothetical protein